MIISALFVSIDFILICRCNEAFFFPKENKILLSSNPNTRGLIKNLASHHKEKSAPEIESRNITKKATLHIAQTQTRKNQSKIHQSLKFQN